MTAPQPGSSAPSPTRRVALLGGSFDPVHRAHVELARQALKQLPVDELWWLPVGHAWQKSRALSPAHHRLAMLELAMQAVEGGHRQRIEPCELRRPGPSYTFDTVLELSKLHPGLKWVLLIGGDQLANFRSWHRWQELLGHVELAVAGRPDSADGPAGIDHLKMPDLPYHPLEMPPMSVSSTDIRSKAAAGADLSSLVLPEVARYIVQNRLYSPAAAG